MTVRTRYAPSPTGIPHVGNIRTALFGWLFARHEGGEFIIRIEDTDRARYDERALDAILESLRWLGLDWDEGPEAGGSHGPYFQSERLEHYEKYARQLIESGHAYECFCSPERLKAVREAQQQRKEPPRYDRVCRDISDSEREAKRADGTAPVVRFKTPLEGTTSFHDIVVGEVQFENATLDDFVMLKSDGFPTYHLAHIVDDRMMEISHVLRGNEWIASAPRHALIHEALGWEPPKYAHLPRIFGPDGKPLAKRHGAVSALEYRDQGFLPEAMFNFLGLLGWSLDDHSVLISREQFIENFSLERVGKNPATFDVEKLTWMNGAYIRELPEERLTEVFTERLKQDLPSAQIDRDLVRRLVPLIRERMKTLAEVAPMTEGFFSDDLSYDVSELLGKRFKTKRKGAEAALRAAKECIEPLEGWDHESLEAALRAVAEEREMKAGDLFMLLRVACAGKPVSPPLFESMELLGRERCLRRIDEALERLTQA